MRFTPALEYVSETNSLAYSVRQQFIEAAIHRSGNSSKRQFIKAAIHQSGNSANGFFRRPRKILPAVLKIR
jgi:hypothetical protein